jgi:hypothetical protein
MANDLKVPATLVEAIEYFFDRLSCVQFFAGLRWDDGIAECPRCQSKRTSFLTTRFDSFIQRSCASKRPTVIL